MYYTYIYIQQSFQHASAAPTAPTGTSSTDPNTFAAADSTTADDNTNDINDDNTNSSSPTALLEALYDNVTNPQFDGLRVRLDTRITESTEYSKSSHVMRYQECFMLVAGGYMYILYNGTVVCILEYILCVYFPYTCLHVLDIIPLCSHT